MLNRDENIQYFSTYWRSLYGKLLDAIPKEAILFNNTVIKIDQEGENEIKLWVQTRIGKIFEETTDFLIAADGINSIVRSYLLGEEELKYSEYITFRGIIDINDPSTHKFNDDNLKQFTKKLLMEFKDLGNCLYYNITDNKTSNCIYMLQEGLINWMWYINKPKPQTEYLTYVPNEVELNEFKTSAKLLWNENFNEMIENTMNPWVNLIVDRDPIDKFVYGRIVLIGDAAHPARPHRGQATSMAIKDAWTLACALNDLEIDVALNKYDKLRVPDSKNVVLFSRFLGNLKQGLIHTNIKWSQATKEEANLCAQNRLFTWNLSMDK